MSHNQYFKKGNSDTAVIFIHGILGSPHQFNFLVELTPKNWSIYNVLLDGHGQTTREFAKTSMRRWEKQIHSLMEKLTKKYENIIIVGHSMGTLFAIDVAILWPQKVKQIFLLCTPLKVSVKASAVNTGLQVFLDKVDNQNSNAVAAKDGYSIQPDKRLWKYLSWLPRYIELFVKIKDINNKLRLLPVPCIAFHSFKDELVSNKTYDILKSYSNIKTIPLVNSGHFHFSTDDCKLITDSFQESCAKIEINKDIDKIYKEENASDSQIFNAEY